MTFLTAAAAELGFGAVKLRGELRLHEVGQPDLQVVNADGRAIGYGETKPIGSAADFARVLESEQVDRYRRSLGRPRSPPGDPAGRPRGAGARRGS